MTNKFLGGFIPKLLLEVSVLCLPIKSVIPVNVHLFHFVLTSSKGNYYLPNCVVSAI